MKSWRCAKRAARWMTELQHGAKGLKHSVTKLCAHFGRVRTTMAKRTKNERVAFLNNLKRSVGAERRGYEKRPGRRSPGLGRQELIAAIGGDRTRAGWSKSSGRKQIERRKQMARQPEPLLSVGHRRVRRAGGPGAGFGFPPAAFRNVPWTRQEQEEQDGNQLSRLRFQGGSHRCL